MGIFSSDNTEVTYDVKKGNEVEVKLYTTISGKINENYIA